MIGSRLLHTDLRPDKNYPDLVYFTLHYTGSGWLTELDWERFAEVDNKMDELEVRLDFFIVSIMMISGKRDWIIYSKNGQLLMKQLSQELAEYGPNMECMYDPRWKQYRDLLKMK